MTELTPGTDAGPAARHVDQTARASAIASIAHRGQVDKLGQAYIEHPRRVAALVSNPDAVPVAWLHDVIEDCGITAADLRDAGIAPEVIEATVLLTRSDDVPDEIYYERIRGNPLALAVKDADIRDNTAPWRTARLSETDRERLAAKYARARRFLGLA